MDIKYLINDFINSEVDDLQEEGSWALDMCEEEGNFHLVSYWINGTYDNVRCFIDNNYSDDLYKYVIERYPNDIENLKSKMDMVYDCYTHRTITYEALASILLKEMQHYYQWYSIYGSEEDDMIDFKKYNINQALKNTDEFPIIKQEDLVAGMLGINDTVQLSDLYDVFAHYSDELRIRTNSLIEDDSEPTFTPDVFLVAAVVARYKNYMDISKKLYSDYALKFIEISTCSNTILKELSILSYVIDDYLNRFSAAPNGLPLHKDMISANIITVNNTDKFIINYRIRGIKTKKICWDNIAEIIYEIPQTAEELQSLIIQMAVDFKRELNGLEKVRNKDIQAITGKYPNKYSASHGLLFTKNINTHCKDKRSNDYKKPMICNYSLALAEKQSLYLIKKSLRYATSNPVISCSFGIDSITVLSLLRRVNRYNYSIVFNNSLVEYPELIKYKKKICAEWDLDSKLTETYPIETYWSIQNRCGWNFQRKGDRRNGKSNSEECCNKIKHQSMNNFVDKLIDEGHPMQVNYTGLRASESRAREQSIKRDNVVYFSKSWKSIRINPISFYSEEMIWAYQKKYEIPYCEVYDKLVYYEDVYDNVEDHEYHKVYYAPRIGCWPCMVRAKGKGYLQFLKIHYRKQYDYLMIEKGLAKDLFIPGAKKIGIIADNSSVPNTQDMQISLFDYNQTTSTDNTLICEDILKNYSLEDMEALIMKRPCKFLA
ncbi:phosphoadenosine phosphosulfate reductase family protein (plasmid) [Clostridium beijerinckii]|uniref:phosphoadenosine phosphosulfate reductase family protein n=1 Tax=Clostridium beijerinckii TaxID=1520 RepID=UPI0022272E8A|nr:phosphoadenosine phosphosulfate reductase family protein [Clostridium beijerinckii]UYZ38972.1 phosphoadenosine phosphosulfate reductase family protein [Clostridium beijerinckii]